VCFEEIQPCPKIRVFPTGIFANSGL